MARAHLLSATPADDKTDFNLAPLLEARECAELDRFRVHSLVSQPDAADLIIFVEFYGAGWYFERVRSHPLVRSCREKCFLFCANPLVIPFLPGVYTGIEKRWTGPRTRPGFYLGRTKNEFTTFTPSSHELPYLFSFMGSVRHASIRERLATVRHPRFFFRDTSQDFERLLERRMNQQERVDYNRRYAELSRSSKFVLCPRGVSPSSIRLFETMRMGRAPVILSDAWVPPIGPNWDAFSVRVRERDFERIPALLERRESEAVEMGQAARREWESWFGEDVLFHRLVELCLDIQRKRKLPERWARWGAYLHYLQPFHLRRLVSGTLRSLRAAGKNVAADPRHCPQE